MFYDFEVIVPANRSESNPVVEELKLTRGVLHHVEVRCKYGPNFMVGARLYHEGHQLYPTNPDSDFREDGRAIIFSDHFPLDTAPYTLTVRAYSPGTTYEHTLYIRLGVLAEEEISPLGGLGGMLQKFLNMVGIGK